MLPLRLFRSRQFRGTNLTTLAVYCGLGGAMFLVVLRLQVSLGYSALRPVRRSCRSRDHAVLSPVPASARPAHRRAASADGRPARRRRRSIPDPQPARTRGHVSDRCASRASSFGRRDGDHRRTADCGGARQRRRRSWPAWRRASTTPSPASPACSPSPRCPALAGIAAGGSIAGGLDAGYETAIRIAAVSTAVGGVAAALLVGRTAKCGRSIHPAVGYRLQRPASLVVHSQP